MSRQKISDNKTGIKSANFMKSWKNIWENSICAQVSFVSYALNVLIETNKKLFTD